MGRVVLSLSLQAFIAEAEKSNITVAIGEQIKSGTQDLTENLERMRLSGAHVFLSFLNDRDHLEVMKEAYNQKLYGEDYVWIGTVGSATLRSSLELDGTVNQQAAKAMVGTIGMRVAGSAQKQGSYQSEILLVLLEW